MPGFNNSPPDSATTPGRVTTVRFDIPERVTLPETLAQERKWADIVPGTIGWLSPPTSQNVVLVETVGWTLGVYSQDTSNIHEKAAADGPYWNVPTGITAKLAFTTTSQMPGVTYGAGVTSGDMLYSRDLKAGDSVSSSNYVNTADQASFPTVTSGNENSPMYRVAVGNTPSGSVPPDQHFRIVLPGNSKEAPDNAATFYFNGIAGLLCEKGYFALTLRGDGRFILWGFSGGNVWHNLREGWYCDPAKAMAGTHHITIESFYKPTVTGMAGIMLFRFTETGFSSQSKPSLTGMYMVLGGYATAQEGFHFAYKVKNSPTAAYAPSPSRLDIRGDVNAEFQGSVLKYYTSGQLVDSPFFIPALMSPTGPQLNCYLYGQFPAGTSVTGTLYDVDSQTSLGTFGTTETAITPSSSQNYQVVFTFTGTASARPVLQGYRIWMDGPVGEVVTPGEFDVQVTAGSSAFMTSATTFIEVRAQDQNPDSAAADIKVIDFCNSLPRLQTRGELSMQIDMTVTGLTNPVVLFRGYAAMPEAKYLRGLPADVVEFGSDAIEYSISAAGMWQRLKERLTNCRWDWANSGDLDSNGNPLPYKVTDAIRTLFGMAGYAAEDVDILDVPIRMFPTDSSDGLILEPQTNISDVIQQWALDYLGGYIYGDPTVGPYGTWRLLSVPPVQPVAAFVSNTSTVPANHLQTNINSYPPTTYKTFSLPTYPIYRNTVTTKVKRPEGNCVVAYGSGEGQGDGTASLQGYFLYNPNSFQFESSQPAPSPTNNIDYLQRPVPIYQYLPAYVDSDGTNPGGPLAFVARRVYDVACHGRQIFTFDAPLAVVQDLDNSTIWRPLRFYDYVLFNGQVCVVMAVNIHYSKDWNQACGYQLMAITGPGQPAQGQPGAPPVLPPSVWHYGNRTAKAITSSLFNEYWRFPRQYATEKKAWGSMKHVLGLPHVPLKMIQNSDGSFPFMVGYDSLG